MDKITDYLRYDPDTGKFYWAKARRKIRVGQEAGSPHNKGYITIKFEGTAHLAHRLAFYFMNGEMPSLDVDHINGDRSDNRWSNLRQVSRQQNLFNKKTYGATPYKGVCFDRSRSKYLASITINGKFKNLGRFDTPEEAHAVYCKVARELHGEYFAVRECRIETASQTK